MRKEYPLVQPMEDWAILKLSQRRQDVVDEVIRKSLNRIKEASEAQDLTIEEQIAKTMYLEQTRMKEEPWSIDPKDEKPFWKSIKKALIQNERVVHNEEDLDKSNTSLLREIVHRYTEEIAGYFSISIYKFARTVLPVFFSRLLNATSAKGMARFFNPNKHLEEKVRLTGEIDEMRELAKKGTIILLPTHSSNLDSILIGWALDLLGLPPFIYGAGLNLFNSRIFGFFMNRLGAYKVDRRKKNYVYNEVLKTFSTVAIRNGCHSLFFPGGTRSRSGALETKLKLGLLGTAVEAQRLNYLEAPNAETGKIFVVPLVLNYHFVLEAQSLIYQHLNNIGQDKFFVADESSSYFQVFKFVWQLFGKGSEIELSFGKAMDIFGNFVDTNGVSYDHLGQKVDTRAYFLSKGTITQDLQRDAEYTRMLGEKVVARFLAENVVFSSHLVAFVGFELLQRQYKKLDLYSFLRLPEADRGVGQEEMIAAIDKVMVALRRLAAENKVRLADHLNGSSQEILKHGIQNLGLYNSRRPLYFTDDNKVASESLSLLHFYYNRLKGYYGLEKVLVNPS